MVSPPAEYEYDAL